MNQNHFGTLSKDQLFRAKNESNLSQKYSIDSLRELKDHGQSKKSLKMPFLDQNKFS